MRSVRDVAEMRKKKEVNPILESLLKAVGRLDMFPNLKIMKRKGKPIQKQMKVDVFGGDK